MRASEFINEAKRGKMSKRQSQSTRGVNIFVDKPRSDRINELNRVMMAAACSDGINPIDMSGESWIGTYDGAFPYTEVEQKMLKAAYKAVGSEFHDLNNGNMKSMELTTTNKSSPVQAFKGFGK
jgi:hypothetical protein